MSLKRFLADIDGNIATLDTILSGDYALNVITHPHDDFYLRVARQDFSNFSSLFIFARSVTVTATESVIWSGGTPFTFLTQAEPLSIVSTSENDTLLGTGARTLYLDGLNNNYEVQTEIIALTGQTPVISTLAYLRLCSAIVMTSGTNSPVSDTNLGTITLTTTSTKKVQGSIVINQGQALTSVCTVPAGKTGYITGVSFSAGQGKQCLFRAKIRNGVGALYAFSVKYAIDLYQNTFQGDLKIPMRIPEKTDMCITGVTSSGTIDACASYGIFLIDN